jgi:hypothetical protein
MKNITPRLLTFNGETLNIGQWSKKLGMKNGTITNRMDSGWSVERALTTPPDLALSNRNGFKGTKNEAELELNDIPYEQQPECVRKLIPKCVKTHMGSIIKQAKYGQKLRREFPAAFNAWFAEAYSK